MDVAQRRMLRRDWEKKPALHLSEAAPSDGLRGIEARMYVDYTKGKEPHRSGIEKGTTGGRDSMLGCHFAVHARWIPGLDYGDTAVCTC